MIEKRMPRSEASASLTEFDEVRSELASHFYFAGILN